MPAAATALEAVAKEAASGTLCRSIYRNATQTVFGEGAARAVLMLVAAWSPAIRRRPRACPTGGPAMPLSRPL